MEGYPKVRSVQPLVGKTLRVTFDNGQVRLYDCKPLLEEGAFRSLRDEAVFVLCGPGGTV